MFRGKVTAVTSAGVYVQTADFGTLGPCQAVVASYTVGGEVLVVNVGTDVQPDLVVVGKVSAAGSGAHPTMSTDNTVARYDGTAGALQGSGVYIFDDGSLDGVTGYLGVGSASGAATVYLSPPAGGAAQVSLRSGSSVRWMIRKSNASESGSNAGSDLEIRRYNDSGSLLSTLSINRATGKITLPDVGTTAGIELGSGGPTITTGTGAPSHSAPNGSLWLRTDGTASTTLYVRAGGAWTALS